MSRLHLSLLPLTLALALAAHAQTPDIPSEPPPPEEKAPPPAPVPAEAAPAPAPTPSKARPATGTTARRPEPQPAAPAADTPRARLAPSLSGETGLLRVAAADAMAPKLVRLQFGLDWFTTGGFFAPDDGHTRVGGTIGVSLTPIQHLEVWLNTRAQSNSNDLTNPRLLQSQGDLTLGAKGYYPVAQLATVGADVQATFLSGIGETSFDFSSTQLLLRALLTADFRKVSEKVPVRGHLNFGFLLDGSKNLSTAPLNDAERFALGVSSYNRIALGLGVEVPVKYVTPYLEYGIEFPLGYLATPGVVIRADGLAPAQTAEPRIVACDPNAEESNCARPAVQRILPQRLALGVRVTAVENLALDAAVELGLTPDVATGVPATPPYNVVLLASYTLDPFAARETAGPPLAVPVLVPELVAKPVETGRVLGTVKNKADGATVSGAVIHFDRAPSAATSAAGSFTSVEMDPGPVKLTITKDGFETGTADAEVQLGQAAELAVTLVPAVREGTLRGRVVDDKDQPLPKVPIEVHGPTTVNAQSADDGSFELKLLAGHYTATLGLEGYLKKEREFELKGGETLSADVVLRKRPKNPVAEVARGMIVVKESVHFVTGEARLAPDAAQVLDAVVDVLVQNKQIRRLRVEGHTDNVGADEANMELSKQRARSVVEYLVAQGIDASRLSSEGFGATRPIAPNLTRRGREQNRRVDFVIVE